MDSVSDLKIGLSNHVVDRFLERVRPALSRQAARRELRRLLELAEVSRKKPSWVPWDSDDALFAVIGVDIVVPLERHLYRDRYVAVTCLARGTLSPEVRERRNGLRRRRPINDGRNRRDARASDGPAPELDED